MTTATLTHRRTIRFDSALFSDLTLLEYEEVWTPVGFQHLEEGESKELLAQFIVQVQPADCPLNEEALLLVRAEKGILKRVYGPCVFRGEEGLILKMGDNTFPVTVDGRDFVCGEMTGDIESDPTSNEDYPVSYLRLTGTDPKLDWLINVRLAEGVRSSDVKQALRQGKPIVDLFLPPPGKGDGGTVIRMQELGEGEFEVEQITAVTTKKDEREAWVIQLKDGRQCWARGKAEVVLKNGWRRDPNKPLTLRVANIRQKGNATHLDCAFVYRYPVKSSKPAEAPEKQVIAQIDELMEQIPQGKEKAVAWARSRGYSNRADMPLEVLLQLQSHLEQLLKPLDLDEIPF